MRSHVLLLTDTAEFTEMVKGKSELTRRRFRIRTEYLEMLGCTRGCLGCRVVNRGTTATNHTEECRKRLRK